MWASSGRAVDGSVNLGTWPLTGRTSQLEALGRAYRTGETGGLLLREVALLAAGGRSSKAIAQRLHLSTRTVETHLARVYRKLGIGTRAEIAPALGVPNATHGAEP